VRHVTQVATPQECRAMTEHTQIAVVTGAGSGIGRLTTQALLEAGWHVVAAGRRQDALAETLEGAGDRGLAVPTDVTDPESVRALFERAREAFARVDLLVNNAGLFGPSGPMEDLAFEDWQAVVATNLTGAFLCAQEAVRAMKSQDPRGGRIINNGSISAHVPRPGAIAYTATKHAITGLTRGIALEGRAFDIACGQIDIGNAATEMTDAMAQGVPQADGSIAPEARTDARHSAKAIVQMASLPLDANVLFMTIMATKMPFVGRG
jgi:NAD(P)-dependent dehydrogenase (short-subunit alcohol dehydrogenase family)